MVLDLPRYVFFELLAFRRTDAAQAVVTLEGFGCAGAEQVLQAAFDAAEFVQPCRDRRCGYTQCYCCRRCRQ